MGRHIQESRTRNPCFVILRRKDLPLYILVGLICPERATPGYHFGAASRKSHAAGTEHLLRVRHLRAAFGSLPEHTIGYRRLFDEVSARSGQNAP
jgi:hypothetical protein